MFKPARRDRKCPFVRALWAFKYQHGYDVADAGCSAVGQPAVQGEGHA